MSENMKKFLELVSKDENLKQKMLAFNDMEPADAIQAGIALAKEHGIELSEADFVKKKSDGELNDDELDAVAGGSACTCFLGGGGDGTDRYDNSFICGCVLYGQGDSYCMCPAFGGGEEW